MEENNRNLTYHAASKEADLEYAIKEQTTQVLIALLDIVDQELNLFAKFKKTCRDTFKFISNYIHKISNFILSRRAKELTYNYNHTRNLYDLSSEEIYGNETVKKELYRLLSHLNMGNIIEPQIMQGLYKLFSNHGNKVQNETLYHTISNLEETHEKFEDLRASKVHYNNKITSKKEGKYQANQFQNLLFTKKKHNNQNIPGSFVAKLKKERKLSQLKKENISRSN